jgi:hypothetical protein
MPDRKLVCVGLNIKLWPQVKESIAEALLGDCGRITVEDIKDAVEARKMQLWAIHDGQIRAVIVTELLNYPQLRILRVVTVSGTGMDKWLDLLEDTLTSWGREHGAQAIEFSGRKGWERVLSKRGFSFPQIQMVKTI